MKLDGDEETREKTPVELAREAIEVETSKSTEQEEKVEAEEAEEDEELEEEIEKEEKTEEDKTKAADDDKKQRQEARIQKRIDKAVSAQKAAEKRAEAAEAALAAKPDADKPGLSEEEVEKRALTKAQQLQLQRDFDSACKKLADEANKIDAKFDDKVTEMAKEVGAIPGSMIEILEDLENGGEILSVFANDPDEYEKIYELRGRPQKMAIALVKFSDKLIAAKKPKTKTISKVPDAGKPVSANGRVTNNTISEKDSMEEFVRKRRAQEEAKRAARH